METLSSQRARALVNPDDGGRLVSLVLDGIELLGSAEVADGLPVGWFQGSFDWKQPSHAPQHSLGLLGL